MRLFTLAVRIQILPILHFSAIHYLSKCNIFLTQNYLLHMNGPSLMLEIVRFLCPPPSMLIVNNLPANSPAEAAADPHSLRREMISRTLDCLVA